MELRAGDVPTRSPRNEVSDAKEAIQEIDCEKEGGARSRRRNGSRDAPV
jgi:hypothetical protein